MFSCPIVHSKIALSLAPSNGCENGDNYNDIQICANKGSAFHSTTTE